MPRIHAELCPLAVVLNVNLVVAVLIVLARLLDFAVVLLGFLMCFIFVSVFL